MERQTLTVQVRENPTKQLNKRLRSEGIIPATLYGKQVPEPISIQVPLERLTACMKTESGANAIIDITVEGRDMAPLPVIVNDIQREPRSHKILHADFYTVSMDTKVTLAVPVQVEGEAPGVRDGGHVELVHYELMVKALPGNIPNNIVVDISHLELGKAVHVSDLATDNFEIDAQPDEVVVMVRAPRGMAEAAEEEAAAADAAEAAAAEVAAEAEGEG